MAHEDAYERLEREIRNQAANVANMARMRLYHPSYGYTKTGIRAELVKLEGMLLAWLVVSRIWAYAGTPIIRDEERQAIQAALGIDLEALGRAVAGNSERKS